MRILSISSKYEDGLTRLGDSFEEMRSLEQNLTFESTKKSLVFVNLCLKCSR